MKKAPRTPKLRAQLEDTFDAFVRSFGGEVVRDLLPPKPKALFKNADYLLFDRSIVAELKCLQKNYLNAAEVNAKINRLIDDWRKDGTLRAEHIVDGKFSTENLPERCHRQAINVFAKPLDEAIAKANEQIKSTKEHFKLHTAKGMLIVANDGNFSLNPEMAVGILRDRLRSRYSAIHSFIYFAPGMEVAVRGVDEAKRVWVDAAARDSDEADPEAHAKLRSAWLQFCGSTGISATPERIRDVGFAALNNR